MFGHQVSNPNNLKLIEMKLPVILITIQLILMSCSNSASDKSIEEKIKIENDLVYYGIAATSTKFGTNPANSGIVENSIIGEDGKLINIYDDGYNGTLTFGNSFPSDYFKSILDKQVCNVKVRFPYSIKYGGKYYTFGWRYLNNVLEPSNIYLWSSSDGIDWQQENDGLAVLSASSDPNSIWYFIWNVAVAIDDHDVFHLVAECAPNGINQQRVGLGYSSAKLENGKIDFNPNKTTSHIVKNGGNPYLYYSNTEKTFLLIHGMIYSNVNSLSSDYWWITASYQNMENKTWITNPKKFSLGKSGIHVADPHAAVVQINGKYFTRLIFSYNQNYIYSIFFENDLDSLLEELIYR
jgi:hypothetical protein